MTKGKNVKFVDVKALASSKNLEIILEHSICYVIKNIVIANSTKDFVFLSNMILNFLI